MHKRARLLNGFAIVALLAGMLAASWVSADTVPVAEARPLLSLHFTDAVRQQNFSSINAPWAYTDRTFDPAFFPLVSNWAYQDWAIDLGNALLPGTITYDLTPESGDIPQVYEFYGNTDGSSTWGASCASVTNATGTNVVSLSCSAPIRYLYVHQVGVPRWSRVGTGGVDIDLLPTPTPTAGASPTGFAPGGNLIRNWNFNVAPLQTGAEWSALNRVIQVTSGQSLPPEPLVGDMPFGSCGPKYWDMSRPAPAGEGGSIWQDFQWGGGPMYVNFEAITDSFLTRGHAEITNKHTGATVEMPAFTNGSFTWLSFKWLSPSQPAGEYRLTLAYDDTSFYRGAMAVDNVNVRRTYWGNDCPASDYHGSIPSNAFQTATPLPQATLIPPQPATPLNQNCDFEQGWSAWAHNPSSQLVSPGGGTGPTFAYLYSIPISPFEFVNGDIWTPFDWPGGSMYVSYFTGAGSQPVTRIRNLTTGTNLTIQSGQLPQTFNGWAKHSYISPSLPPGQYVFEANVPTGHQATFDGVAVAAGSYAAGPCSTANNPTDNNATATAQASGTAGAATDAPAATQTAAAAQTQVADNFATFAAIVAGTQTQSAAGTSTQGAGATATRRAVETQSAGGTQTAQWNGIHATMTQNAIILQTAIAGWTATAAGNGATETAQWDGIHATMTQNAIILQTAIAGWTATAQAAATATPVPTVTPQPTYIPPATVETPTPEATCAVDVMVCSAVDLTLTAAWGGFLTAVANSETQWAAETQAHAATQTQAVIAATTQAVVIGQTATARAIQTGTAQAQQTAGAATQSVRATQTASAIAFATASGGTVQAATSTAAARQTSLPLTSDANDIATATAQAATTGTHVAVVQATGTAQAIAAATQTAAALQTSLPATNDANQISTATAVAQATQTAAALQTSLPATGEATAIAQATQTAQALATQIAQGEATSTAQALGTASAQGTPPPVDIRPDPQPGADCIRPASPLYIADWIDYTACRVLTWFVWTDDNSDQLAVVIDTSCDREPFGTVCEFMLAMGGMRDSWQSLNWGGSGLTCALEDENPFMAVKEAYGILRGQFAFESPPPDYDHSCGVSIGWLIGENIERGTCYAINLLCAHGLMQWMQYAMNAFLIGAFFVYIQVAWISRATEG